MSQHEDGDVRGQLRADEGRHVGEHARRRARLALLAGLRHAPPPAPLVEAVDGYPALREMGEEAVVTVYVVAEAVEHDHFGFDGALGLEIKWKVRAYVSP